MKRLKQRLSKKRKTETTNAVALKESSLKITNETVAEHREEVLGQARKFRYPLAQSRHKIVLISVWLAIFSVVIVFAYSLVLLYKQQNTSRYAYQFVSIIPLPIAQVDGSLVSYEDYLFDLRHTLHYKETQENLDFSSEDGKSQLQGLKQQTLDKVIDDQIVEKATKQEGIYVSSKEIDAEIDLLQSQQQLGADKTVLNTVLKKYYDWTYDDFRRSIHDQLLRQKYLSFLEKDKVSQAKDIVNQAKGGKDFGELAKEFSGDESTKQSGGVLPPLTRDRRDIPLELIQAAFTLKAGEISDPIETPYGVEIIKVTETNGTEVKSQHIVIKYRSLDEILLEKRSQVKVRRFIKVQ